MEPSVPADALVGLSYFCVVVSGGVATQNEFTARDSFVSHLTEIYAETRDKGDRDTRIFAYVGRRLVLAGAADRTVTFPDGTRFTITPAPEASPDHLLSPIDRVVVM